jgi:hypothetical protein
MYEDLFQKALNIDDPKETFFQTLPECILRIFLLPLCAQLLTIDKENETIIFLEFEHHDKVYR